MHALLQDCISCFLPLSFLIFHFFDLWSLSVTDERFYQCQLELVTMKIIYLYEEKSGQNLWMGWAISVDNSLSSKKAESKTEWCTS